MEKPGPGAASTWDPGFRRKIEGIQRRGSTDPWVTRMVGALNEHAVAGRPRYKAVSDVLRTKLGTGVRNLPGEAQRFVTELSAAVNHWIWSGGFDTPIGRAAQDYINEGDLEKHQPGTLAWAKTIVESIRNAPEMSGTLHRGLLFNVPWDESSPDVPVEFTDAKRGDVFRLDRPSSFSTASSVAKRFGRTVRLVIQPRYKGLHVHTVDFDTEDEVITYGRFRVETNTVDRDGSRTIVLRQLETH